MSESEKHKGGDVVIESSDLGKEKRRAGFLLLFIAVALIFGASTPERAGSGSAFWEWLRLSGFIFAGAGMALVKTPWPVGIAFVVFVALNYLIVDADAKLAFALLVGGIALPWALCYAPAIKKTASHLCEYAVRGFFPNDNQENERELARRLAQELGPVITLIACVVAVFCFLGLIGEILTVGILAIFAWCAKMEKYYGASKHSFIGAVIKDPEGGKDICALIPPLFTLKAFNPETEEEKPNRKICISVAGNAYGPLYFCVTMAGKYPKGWSLWMDHSLYKFWGLLRMVRDTNKIMEEEMKSRNNEGGIWHTDWQGYGASMNELGFSSHSIRGISSGILLAMVNLYFWHYIRYGCPFWPRIVRPIAQNAARLFYFFYKSDAVARETTRMRGFWL